MATSPNAANIVNRGIKRTVFRWIHIVCGIPIVGYIYDSPSDTHNYAHSVRYFFLPVLILSGLWMWKGHVVRRLIWKRGVRQVAPVSTSQPALTWDKISFFGASIHEQNEPQGGWTFKKRQKVAGRI
jgi:hypothetical protein